MAEQKKDISFEIREHLGSLQSRSNGWEKQLNLISWNGQEPPKFDIRSWSKDQKHMSRGITLFEDEMRQIVSMYLNWKNKRVVEGTKEEQRENEMRFRKSRPGNYSSTSQELHPDEDGVIEDSVAAEPALEETDAPVETPMAAEVQTETTAERDSEGFVPPEVMAGTEASVAEEIPF